jgi:hypothetical protein
VKQNDTRSKNVKSAPLLMTSFTSYTSQTSHTKVEISDLYRYRQSNTHPQFRIAVSAGPNSVDRKQIRFPQKLCSIKYNGRGAKSSSLSIINHSQNHSVLVNLHQIQAFGRINISPLFTVMPSSRLRQWLVAQWPNWAQSKPNRLWFTKMQ